MLRRLSSQARALAALSTVALAAAACGGATAHAAERGAKTLDYIELTNRVVDLDGTISHGMIKKAQEKVLALDSQSKDPIWITINSGGGSVEAGLILIDTFKALKSPVHCLVESKAYSMAAITLVFCDKKYALPHATIMLHEASYGTMGEDPSNRSRLDFLTKYLDGLHVEIAQRLKMPHDKYRARIRDAWWLLADEAQKAGVVDGLVREIRYTELPTEQTEEKKTVTVQEKTTVVPNNPGHEKIPKRR